MIANIVMVTGWSVHHITHEIGFGTLLVLNKGVKHEEPGKPTGLLADPNLDLSKLEGLSGLKYMRE